MENTQKEFKSLIINQKLKNLQFYNISEKYLVFDPDHRWVIEAGIEMTFNDYTLSLGWNSEMQLYEMINGNIKELTGDLEIYEMDFKEHPNINKLIGQNITDVSINWTWYQKMDNNYEISKEKSPIPQELVLSFDDGSVLQLATVMFQIENDNITNPVFDSQNTILITVNQPIEIIEIEY